MTVITVICYFLFITRLGTLAHPTPPGRVTSGGNGTMINVETMAIRVLQTMDKANNKMVEVMDNMNTMVDKINAKLDGDYIGYPKPLLPGKVPGNAVVGGGEGGDDHLPMPANNTEAVTDCEDLYGDDQGKRPGVYTLYAPKFTVPFSGYCDSGWTVMMRRTDDNIVDFNREWLSYKYGFGNPQADYWLGNEYIHRLTTVRQYTLRIEVHFRAENQTMKWSEYANFRLAAENKYYRLHIGAYKGNTGNILNCSTVDGSENFLHDGMYFTTSDVDHDYARKANCGYDWMGGWWHNRCYYNCYTCSNPKLEHWDCPATKEMKGKQILGVKMVVMKMKATSKDKAKPENS